MTENKNDKKYEDMLIATIALNWDVSKQVARDCLCMFKNQNTK